MDLDLSWIRDAELWGNRGELWAAALGVAVAVTALLLLLRRLLSRRLRALAERRNDPDPFLADAVASTRAPLIGVAGLVAGAELLQLPPGTAAALHRLVGLAGLVQVGLWGNVAVRFAVTRFIGRRRGEPDDPARSTGQTLLGLLGRTVVWSAVVLLTLANVGVDVTALVAGLGVGGIAIALALQNVLSDLFASVSILLDKPFRRGDFVIVGDTLGSVEKIGLKTTHIRSLWGEQVVVSNADLLSSRIRNYKRMAERRIVFEVKLVYSTPAAKLPVAARILREAIEAQDRARFDRAHLKELGDFSLVFEAVYYVLSPDYNVYMDVHQAILLAIFQRFEAEGLTFAFPTRSVFLQREDEAA